MPLPEGLPSRTLEVVWDHDLNAYIETHLGRPWSIQQNGFLGQETFHTYEVWPNPGDTAVVEQWLASPPAQCPGRLNQPGFGELVDIVNDNLFNELCNRGLLPEGDLFIHVWW